MSADRQQRRQRKRQLLQLGEAATRRGMPATPGKEQVLGYSLLLRDTLADGGEDRASRAASLMHKVFEASLKSHPPRMEIACRKGCGYCCYTWVGASAPELLLIARTLRSEHAGSAALGADAVLARAAATTGLDIARRFGAKLPCALLVGEACGTYRVRPTVCRQVTSASLATCIEEYEGKDGNGEVVVSKVFLDHARNCRIPLQAALLSLNLSTASYELGAGLSAALQPGAEARWLDRADPFSGIATSPSDPAPVQQAIRLIASEIAAL